MIGGPASAQPVPVDLYSDPVAAFSGDDPGSDRARVLFDLLADRHLPVTPALASALAQMERTDAPATAAFWGRGYGLAGAAIGLAGKLGHRPAWHAMNGAFVQAVAEPILRAAALQTGSLPLAGFGTIADSGTTYAAACVPIEAFVDKALSRADVMGKAFWIGAGVALLGGFRRQGNHLPPLPDLALAQVIFGIEPLLQQDRRWRQNLPRPSARSKRLRMGMRPREGGVTGVLHTRRERDIPDALPSTFVMPDALRLVKLLEEGFMVTHRPPPRRPDRDLLSLTLLTPAAAGLEAAVLVKAAWVDAAIRLRILLTNLALPRTEIGFAAFRDGGMATAAVSLERDHGLRGLDAMAIRGAIRAHAIAVSSLLPDILDTLALPMPQGKSVYVAAVEGLVQSCAARRTEAALRAGQRRSEVARTTDYARVCLFEIGPAQVRGDEKVVVNWRRDKRDLEARFGFDRAQDIFAAKVLCPPQVVAGDCFVLVSDDGTGPQQVDIGDGADPSQALAKVIGALSAWMITQNILAAAHG